MPKLDAERVAEEISKGTRAKVDAPIAGQFNPGDKVRTRTIHPTGHTRLPRYARGKTGFIDRDHGVFVFPDTNAHGDPRPQHCYSVRFTADVLWGPQGDARTTVYIDLWDDHLEPS